MLNTFGEYVLDVLGEFGGGRGSPLNDYVRFGLGAILFGILLYFAIRNHRTQRSEREAWLILGFGFGLARELFKFAVKSLETQGVVNIANLELFFPPIDHFLLAAARVAIGAAFLGYLLESTTFARKYLVFGLGAFFISYVVVAPFWWEAVEIDPAIKFSKHWGDWVFHTIGFVAIVIAIRLLLSTRGWVRTAVVLAFTLMLLDDALMLINLYWNDELKSFLTPIRHNAHLASIAVLGYIYVREHNERYDQLVKRVTQDDRTRAVGKLAAGVAHDFNNLLMIIRGFTEIAKSSKETDREALEQIEAASDRAAKLVKQLITFSKVGKTSGDSCVVDTELGKLEPLLKKLLGDGCDLKLDLGAVGIAVGISETQLGQIATNLIANACDAMDGKGEIIVTTRVVDNDTEESGVLVLSVKDTGAGMDPQTLKHAFDPYFTTKKLGKGSGLGLATVYAIVDSAGGTIGISSMLGQGTEIKAQFKAVQPATSSVPAQVEYPSSGPLRILVAEDEEQVARYVVTVLKEAGHSVALAANGAQAVEKMLTSDGQFDLLLFDFAMPELNGYEAYQKIGEAGLIRPVLFMSGNRMEPQHPVAGHPHIDKPFAQKELLAKISETVDATRRRQSQSAPFEMTPANFI